MAHSVMVSGSSLTNLRLAEAFLGHARERLRALEALRHEADPSDVIREARDIIVLCFRGMLRIIGVEVPRWRDVGDILAEHMGWLPGEVTAHGARLLGIYRELRKERSAEPVEHGSAPPEKLVAADAERALAEAEWVLSMAQLTIDLVSRRRAPTLPV